MVKKSTSDMNFPLLKEKKPSRIHGMVVLYTLLINFIVTYIIIILSGAQGWAVLIESLIKILSYHFAVFTVVWAAIFGNGIAKKLKGA